MKKLVFLSFLLAALSQLSMAQSIGDDLYFVPKKEKKDKTIQVERATEEKTVTVITSDGEIRQIPVSETNLVTISSKQLQKATATVRDASGKERNVDEYNRRYTSSSVDAETVYVEEEETEEEGEWLRGFEGSQEDYEYATRLIRFRSPRVAVPVSSPLYWDIVYSWSPLDWNVYIDGSYAYAFPTLYNPSWWSWHYDPWYWNYGWNWHISYGGWGFGWGWNDPWYHHHHYWGYYPHHHHHHGPIWAGGGGHIGGSWRDGFYYDNRRRAADRPNAVRGDRREDNTVRATRGNDRGTVASRENSSTRADRTSGRVVAGRNTDDAVRSTTSGRNTSVKDAVPAEGRTSRNTVSRSNSSSSTDRSTGNYTRSSSNRSSTGRTTNSSVRNSSSRSSSSGNVSRSNSNSTRSSSSDNVSRSSSSRSSSSFSSGSSSSSRSSSMGGGSSRSSGGGGGRSGGGRR
ncbi:MAG: hypothetical protein IKJ42_04865 [Bacteroidaceae bacterium]|nr:hypothetical protein [Bacteroidaceae bacterium]